MSQTVGPKRDLQQSPCLDSTVKKAKEVLPVVCDLVGAAASLVPLFVAPELPLIEGVFLAGGLAVDVWDISEHLYPNKVGAAAANTGAGAVPFIANKGRGLLEKLGTLHLTNVEGLDDEAIQFRKDLRPSFRFPTLKLAQGIRDNVIGYSKFLSYVCRVAQFGVLTIIALEDAHQCDYCESVTCQLASVGCIANWAA